MLRYFHGMSCQVMLSEMPILLSRSIILAPSLTLPSPKTVSRLMKQMDHTEQSAPLCTSWSHKYSVMRPVNTCHSYSFIHYMPSNPQSRCIAADILWQPVLCLAKGGIRPLNGGAEGHDGDQGQQEHCHERSCILPPSCQPRQLLSLEVLHSCAFPDASCRAEWPRH